MNTILCYGDSNTWGYVPNKNRRYAFNERWTGILQQQLGSKYLLIEEGLPGRTTVLDDPVEGAHKNGERYLLPCLETHHPDMVIVVLGTNDFKHRFARTAGDVAQGAGRLVEIIQGFKHPMMKQAPKVLLVAPPPVIETGYFATMFEGGQQASVGLSEAFHVVADRLGCDYLDAGKVIRSCPNEGIHWQQSEHLKLAETLVPLVTEIFVSL